MALARVQATARGNHGFAASFTFPAFAAPPTVGNALILFICNWTASPTVATITDNYGNTYVQADDITNTIGARIWYCAKVAATGSPFTITASYVGAGLNYATTCAVEVSGVDTGLLVDQVKHATGGVGSGFTVGTGSTAALTGPENFMAALVASRGTGATTVESVSPAWTQEFEDLTTATCPGEGDTRVVTGTAGTTTSASWTIATQNSWAATVVAFRAPSPPPSADVLLYTGAASPSDVILREAGTTVPPESRVTQDAVEVLTATPAARVTQDVVELLSVSGPPESRVSQDVVEVLSFLPPESRVTQDVIEVLSVPPIATRVTQLAVERFDTQAAPTRTTQVAVEVFYPRRIPVRTTHTPVELFNAKRAALLMTQEVVELFVTLPPCVSGDFPIDIVTPGGSCPTPLPEGEFIDD